MTGKLSNVSNLSLSFTFSIFVYLKLYGTRLLLLYWLLHRKKRVATTACEISWKYCREKRKQARNGLNEDDNSYRSSNVK